MFESCIKWWWGRNFSYAPALLLNRLQPEGRQSVISVGNGILKWCLLSTTAGVPWGTRQTPETYLQKELASFCEGAIGIGDPGFVIEAHCSLMPLWNSLCLRTSALWFCWEKYQQRFHSILVSKWTSRLSIGFALDPMWTSPPRSIKFSILCKSGRAHKLAWWWIFNNQCLVFSTL